MTHEMVFIWDYRELEKLITGHFNINYYNIIAVEELQNGAAIICVVDNEPLVGGVLDDYEQEQINKVKASEEPSYSFDLVMNELCRAGVIPAGKHVISVSW